LSVLFAAMLVDHYLFWNYNLLIFSIFGIPSNKQTNNDVRAWVVKALCWSMFAIRFQPYFVRIVS
jgi:hypothetical protein